MAESVLIKQQLLILNRSRRRSPNLRFADRVIAGVCTLVMRSNRLVRAAVVLKPSTLLRLDRTLTTRKYRRLFSSRVRKKTGPKGPSREVIAPVVDMKQRNPTWGSPRIAQQITLAFGIPMNKDVVIGTIRQECLDRTLFWTATDLEMKLLEFLRYYNGHRAHAGLDGSPPQSIATRVAPARVSARIAGNRTVVDNYRTPMAA